MSSAGLVRSCLALAPAGCCLEGPGKLLAPGVRPHHPCPHLQAQQVLAGCWKLVYTSNAQTLLLLNAIRSMPLVDVGDVYQVISEDGLAAQNKVRVNLGGGGGATRPSVRTGWLLRTR